MVWPIKSLEQEILIVLLLCSFTMRRECNFLKTNPIKHYRTAVDLFRPSVYLLNLLGISNSLLLLSLLLPLLEETMPSWSSAVLLTVVSLINKRGECKVVVNRLNKTHRTAVDLFRPSVYLLNLQGISNSLLLMSLLQLNRRRCLQVKFSSHTAVMVSLT